MDSPDRPTSYRAGTADGLELLWNGKPLGPGRLLDELTPRTVAYYLVLLAALLTILVTWVGNAQVAHPAFGSPSQGAATSASEASDQMPAIGAPLP